jgi:Protein of unknown function (DUF2934)
MSRVPVIQVVRRAYQIWELAGKPDGKDQEFYFQAEQELEAELARREAANSEVPPPSKITGANEIKNR